VQTVTAIILPRNGRCLTGHDDGSRRWRSSARSPKVCFADLSSGNHRMKGARPVDQVEQAPLEPAAPSAAMEDFEHLNLTVRRTLAEAMSRSVTDAEPRLWQARSRRVKRLREMVNPDDLSQVLEAIAVLDTEQQIAIAGIATQLAGIDTWSHR